MEFGNKNLNTAQAQEIPPNTADIMAQYKHNRYIHIHAINNILLLESIHTTSEMSILCPFMSTEHLLLLFSKKKKVYMMWKISCYINS